MNVINLTPPANWVGSIPEYYAWWALTKLKIDFIYQQPEFGGRLSKGGQISDFYVESLNLAINIQSLYWHTGASRQANDRMQKLILEGQGITVIWIDEEDILRDPLYYIKEALRGVSHSALSDF